jgi:diaminopimelate decarboxylase
VSHLANDAKDVLLGSNAREHLANVKTLTDNLSVDERGNLVLDGHRADDLLQRFGSPLYVISEKTVRANFRRIHKAFADKWPKSVVVLYAIKANCNPAIRAIIHDEGGGGDCFGLGELWVTFEGGADPQFIHMNGGNKTFEELEAAVQHGIVINIDALDEIDMLDRICRDSGATARVAVRIKSAPDVLNVAPSDYMNVADAQLFLQREKWGFSKPAAIVVVERVLKKPGLRLCGFNIHTPRFTRDPKSFAECTRDFAATVVAIRDRTGYVPDMIDLGGGWPRERDPESRRYSLNSNSVEDFAAHVATSILETFAKHDLAVPELRLEPGRFIIGNASVLLGRAGAIKRDCDMVWLNVDFSTNNLVRIESAGSTHHMMPASEMDRPYIERVQIVGPTCVDSRLADDWPVPEIKRGDPMALLDAGMYSESVSTHMNSVPLPATVLINGDLVDVIRERETHRDVYRQLRMPERFENDN